MKINWGTAIAIFFAFYISGLGFVLAKSFKVDRSLVKEDYYAHDLAYQKHYDKIVNQTKDFAQIAINYNIDNETIEVNLGESKTVINGTVTFYRASDKSKDHVQPFELASGETVFNIKAANLITGKWEVQVEWESSGKQYFKSEVIYI